MLLLVLADNYLGLYAGWEGVGLASYLLIGFWSHKPSAATAAKKAFVVNRVGDMGLAIALMIMFASIGSISFAGVFTAAPALSEATLTAIGLLLLLGRAANRHRYRCSPGWAMRWRVRRPCRHSSTRPPWSPRAST